MTRKVKEDEKGLFVTYNGSSYRPQANSDHSYMSDTVPDCLEGDVVKVKNIAQSSLIKIDGKFWFAHYEK